MKGRFRCVVAQARGRYPVWLAWLACLALLAAVLAPAVAYAATGQFMWARYYNGTGNWYDIAWDVAVDHAGNVYVAGSSQASLWSNSDFLTIKYDRAGRRLWAKRYDGAAHGDDSAQAVAVDEAGNVYVTGDTSTTAGGDDYLTIKYSPSGVKRWARRYDAPAGGGDSAGDVGVDGRGYVYVTGLSDGGASNLDCLTLRYTPAGTLSWARRYNSPSNGWETGDHLAVDALGNVSVAGGASLPGVYGDILTLRYSPSGVRRWAKRYDGAFHRSDSPLDIAMAPNGDVCVAGFSMNLVDMDAIVVRYSSGGTKRWARRYDQGPADDVANGVAVDAHGNVYAAGKTHNFAGNDDCLALKYSAVGVRQWVRFYNGPAAANDWANDIVLDDHGNAFVAGAVRNLAGNDDAILIKYTPSGAKRWARRYNGSANDGDQAMAVAWAPGSVFSVGYGVRALASPVGRDMLTLRYQP